jgi:lysophospholipase L1-like esterase
MTTATWRPWFWRAGAAAGISAGMMMVYRLGSLFVHARHGYRIAERSRPFERHLPDCRRRALVIGDSTGVGTGAACSQDSIAGLFAREFPDVAVTNLARNGAKAADAVQQLASLPTGRFDVVFVHVGGNDILRATPHARLEQDITAVLRAARERSDNVIFMSCPNVGLCPVFFAPFSWLLAMRSRAANDLFIRASGELGVHYVDLFRERGDDVFSRDPQRYFAEDRLHPTSESYRAAYDAICRDTPLHGLMRDAVECAPALVPA